jgi:hypothetical protein
VAGGAPDSAPLAGGLKGSPYIGVEREVRRNRKAPRVEGLANGLVAVRGFEGRTSVRQTPPEAALRFKIGSFLRQSSPPSAKIGGQIGGQSLVPRRPPPTVTGPTAALRQAEHCPRRLGHEGAAALGAGQCPADALDGRLVRQRSRQAGVGAKDGSGAS